jgi:serine/threonine protein kinase
MISGAYSFPISIWSLGITLYELMTLRIPFSVNNYKKEKNILFKTITNDPIPLINRSYSNELKNLVYAMLNKNPSQRITLSEILSHPLITKYLPPSDSLKIDSTLVKSDKHLPLQKDESNYCSNANSIEDKLALSEYYFYMAIEDGHIDSMLNYANRLSEGVYGAEYQTCSEKYYLMAIKHKHIGAMLKYANYLSDGFYGEDRRIDSEQYYLMAIENKDFDTIYKKAISISKKLSQVSNSNLSKQTELIKDKKTLDIILSLILFTGLFPEFDRIHFNIDYWLAFKEIQLHIMCNYAKKFQKVFIVQIKSPFQFIGFS